jgi:hypothetical protein
VIRSEQPRLPPGYRLDRSDPDVRALRRPLRIIVFDLASFRGARVAVGWTHAELSWAPAWPFRRLGSGFGPTVYPNGLLGAVSIKQLALREANRGVGRGTNLQAA